MAGAARPDMLPDGPQRPSRAGKDQGFAHGFAPINAHGTIGKPSSSLPSPPPSRRLHPLSASASLP